MLRMFWVSRTRREPLGILGISGICGSKGFKCGIGRFGVFLGLFYGKGTQVKLFGGLNAGMLGMLRVLGTLRESWESWESVWQ